VPSAKADGPKAGPQKGERGGYSATMRRRESPENQRVHTPTIGARHRVLAVEAIMIREPPLEMGRPGEDWGEEMQG